MTSTDVGPSAALVIAVGSNYPQRRELPSELIQQAAIVVDDLDACRIEAGDLLLGLPDAGWQHVVELKNWCLGQNESRSRSTGLSCSNL